MPWTVSASLKFSSFPLAHHFNLHLEMKRLTCNLAGVTGYDRAFTEFCALTPRSYHCSSAGRLSREIHHIQCSNWCRCVSIGGRCHSYVVNHFQVCAAEDRATEDHTETDRGEDGVESNAE